MTAFVTVAEIKRGLRIDGTDSDAMLDFLASAATGAVTNHIKGTALDSPDDYEPDDVVKQATIMLVGYWFDSSDASQSKADGELSFQLPPPVCALLARYRTPTIA